MLGRIAVSVGVIVTLASVGPTPVVRSPGAEDLHAHAHRGTGSAFVDAPQRSYQVPIEGTGSKARVFRTGFSGWEPSLGVSGRKVFVSSAIRGASYVARSLNGGRDWQQVAPSIANENPHQVSLDPYVHLDPDARRLFLADLVGSCSVLSYSDDHGKSWGQTDVACGPVVNDHENVFTGRPVSSPTTEYGNLVYYCYNTIAAAMCARSLDGGLSFLPAGSPAFSVVDPEASGGTAGVDHFCFTPAVGHGVADRKGTIYLPRAHCGQPWVAVSQDEGLTWTRSQVANNGTITIDGDPSHEAAVDVDAKGNIYYAWVARDRMPYVAVSRDGGKTWTQPLKAAPRRVKETGLPALAVSPGGAVAVAFMGSENSPGEPFPDSNDPLPDGGHAPAYEKVTWEGYVATADLSRRSMKWRVVKTSRDGDPLVRGICAGNRCQQVGDFIDVQISGDEAWAAFVDACVGSCVRGPRAANNSGELLVMRVPLRS